MVLGIGLGNNLTETSSPEQKTVAKTYLIKQKIFSRLNSSSPDNETLQKDFIHHPQFENINAFTVIFFLLAFVVFIKALRVLYKRQQNNYTCQFKLLFPEHAFW